MIAALLSVAAPWISPPPCLHTMQSVGVGAGDTVLAIKPDRGTFGLAAVLGLNRRLLPDRLTLTRLLRGKGALSGSDQLALDAIDGRLPGLVEIPWIRLIRSPGATAEGADALLDDVRARYANWGVTWLKRPFDNNSRWEHLIGEGGSWPLTGNLQG